MQILLLSMPDSFEHTPTIAVRMPNGGLASLAGNVDRHHQVAIADLILAQSSVQATVVRLMEQLQPRLVGLSVMTFQRGTARRIISLIRSRRQVVRSPPRRAPALSSRPSPRLLTSRCDFVGKCGLARATRSRLTLFV
jgi:hypothetical protein